jgi:DNA-binding response OmpR family regulator
MASGNIVLLGTDLMFGSKVEGMINQAGFDPVLVQSPEAAAAAAEESVLLIVDLTADEFDGTTVAAAGGIPTIGFYAHTDDEMRMKALGAGFKQVVPRSRMMREGVDLILDSIG